jgi:hypothetical protein
MHLPFPLSHPSPNSNAIHLLLSPPPLRRLCFPVSYPVIPDRSFLSAHSLSIPRKLILQPNRNLDIHTTQLLDEEFGRIRHGDFADSFFRLAEFAVAAVAHLAAYLYR